MVYIRDGSVIVLTELALWARFLVLCINWISQISCSIERSRSVSGENILKIIDESGRKLIISGGVSSIRVLEISNPVLPCSLDYCLMEVACVAVTMKCPVLFSSLEMEMLVLC